MKKILLAALAAAVLSVVGGCTTHNLKQARPAQPPQSPATNGVISSTDTSGSALVPAPRTTTTNWLSRHQKFVEQAKQGGIDVLFLGDSITDFWRNRGSNVWNRYYAPMHAANFGISGDRTQHVLWRIENGELDGIKPKITVLMIGTNNSGKDSPDDIALAIRKIIEDIHAKIPSTKILLLGVFPRGPRPNRTGEDDSAHRMEVIHDVNSLIAYYDDGKTVKYLDIGDKFLGPDGKIPSEVMPDQLHPSERGYEIWAEAMNPALEELSK